MRFIVRSYSQAFKHVMKNPVDALLAINDKHCKRFVRPKDSKIPYLKIAFEDDFDNHPDKPTPNDVIEIIKFLKGTLNIEGTCLIHCEAGVSRSGASALIGFLMLHNWDLAMAWDDLLAIRPQAVPNMLMCQYADDILGLGGNFARSASLYADYRMEQMFGRQDLAKNLHTQFLDILKEGCNVGSFDRI